MPDSSCATGPPGGESKRVAREQQQTQQQQPLGSHPESTPLSAAPWPPGSARRKARGCTWADGGLQSGGDAGHYSTTGGPPILRRTSRNPPPGRIGANTNVSKQIRTQQHGGSGEGHHPRRLLQERIGGMFGSGSDLEPTYIMSRMAEVTTDCCVHE